MISFFPVLSFHSYIEYGRNVFMLWKTVHSWDCGLQWFCEISGA